MKSNTWSPDTGYSDERTYNADVYVFALLTATLHDEYDVLDTGQWHFWVMSRPLIERHSAASIALSTVRRLVGEPVIYLDLATSIRAAFNQVL